MPNFAFKSRKLHDGNIQWGMAEQLEGGGVAVEGGTFTQMGAIQYISAMESMIALGPENDQDESDLQGIYHRLQMIKLAFAAPCPTEA